MPYRGMIKAELIWRHSWPTRRAAELAIYNYFYNARRKHSTLKRFQLLLNRRGFP